MQYFNLFGQSQDDPAIVFPESVTEEVEVFPLKRIPVVTEDQPVHDGEQPCGDPDCPCAIYGYGVPSLD